MKKIILNEDRLSVLLEYAGYVNVFERLVDYISQKFSESCYRNAAENGIDIYNKDTLRSEYSKIMKSQNYKPMDRVVIQSYELYDLIPSNIRIKTIMILPSMDDTSFNIANSVYNEKAKMFTLVCLKVNPILSFGLDGLDGLKKVFTHEMTHVYEYLQRYTKTGYQHNVDEFNKKYYDFHNKENNIISDLSYTLNSSEINAYISELYRELVDNGMSRKYAYEWLHNTNIGKKLIHLEKLKERFINEPKLVKEVMMWLNNNPQHRKMFPSVRNNNFQSIQKMLINMLNDRINYINKKVDRIIRIVNEHFKNNQNE